MRKAETWILELADQITQLPHSPIHHLCAVS